jgi:hypothetical protein
MQIQCKILKFTKLNFTFTEINCGFSTRVEAGRAALPLSEKDLGQELRAGRAALPLTVLVSFVIFPCATLPFFLPLHSGLISFRGKKLHVVLGETSTVNFLLKSISNI